MKEKEDKKIEQFVDRVMKEVPLESPSYNFTSKVMANVLATDKNKATVYKPVISKTGWLIIFGSIIAAITYFIIKGGPQGDGLPGMYSPRIMDFIKPFSEAHLFQFSGLTINIIVLSTILIFIQITLLKNHLNKRFEK